jgi:hypothetical protein
LADFLTKSLGKQVFDNLVHEAIGTKPMREIDRFTRRHWKEEYDKDAMMAKISRGKGVSNVLPDDAQGGMLKTDLIDVIGLNRMIVVKSVSKKDDIDVHVNACVMCDTIDDYVKYEQHRLHVLTYVMAHDMKAENREYGSIRVLSQRVNANMY